MRGRWREPIVAGMTTEALQMNPNADSRAWARVVAAAYDPFLWIGERAGMRRHRHDLVTLARGRTLEIGSGTGLNLLHYPDDLDGLVLAEPDPSMRRRLENAVRRSGRRAQVIDARAERLPFGDATIDTVVSTLVLCTVDAPDVALREDRARAARRRAAAVHRACALRLAAAGPLAGSSCQAVAAFRGGVPMQPRDTRADGCVRVCTRRAPSGGRCRRSSAHWSLVEPPWAHDQPFQTSDARHDALAAPQTCSPRRLDDRGTPGEHRSAETPQIAQSFRKRH
jgi:hypothetical protein